MKKPFRKKNNFHTIANLWSYSSNDITSYNRNGKRNRYYGISDIFSKSRVSILLWLIRVWHLPAYQAVPSKAFYYKWALIMSFISSVQNICFSYVPHVCPFVPLEFSLFGNTNVLVGCWFFNCFATKARTPTYFF